MVSYYQKAIYNCFGLLPSKIGLTKPHSQPMFLVSGLKTSTPKPTSFNKYHTYFPLNIYTNNLVTVLQVLEFRQEPHCLLW
jgi:hypothetical protein